MHFLNNIVFDIIGINLQIFVMKREQERVRLNMKLSFAPQHSEEREQ